MMREKKTMRLEFMLAMLVLLLAITLGIFLPYLSISGDRIKSAWEELRVDNKILEQVGSQMEDAIERIDEEKMSVSGWEIITKTGDLQVSEGVAYYDEIMDFVDGIKLFQALLGIFYGMAVVLFILLILGYFLRWNRLTLSILTAVYSAAGATLFWYLLWGIRGRFVQYLPEEVRDGLVGDMCEKVIGIFWKAIRGNALLPTFILLLILFTVSILTMLLFNRSLYGMPAVAASETGVMQEMNMTAPFPVNSLPVNPISPAPLPGDSFYSNDSQNTIPLNPVNAPRPQPAYQPQQLPDYMSNPPIQQKSMGSVRCTEGTAIGQGYRLQEGRKVVVGKSPQRATLVINNPHISNVHCSIRYNAVKNVYIVKDHSMNGTFVNGMRLQNGIAAEYPAGTVLSLADGSNKITLG